MAGLAGPGPGAGVAGPVPWPVAGQAEPCCGIVFIVLHCFYNAML